MGLDSWFRKVCDGAGLKHCSAHGLRHVFTRRLAEASLTANEIIALTGHQNVQEVTTSTKAASRSKLADAGMAKILSTNKEQKIGQPRVKVGKKSKKNNKNNDL